MIHRFLKRLVAVAYLIIVTFTKSGTYTPTKRDEKLVTISLGREVARKMLAVQCMLVGGWAGGFSEGLFNVPTQTISVTIGLVAVLLLLNILV